jgi:serine/threonine protein kinase
MMNYNNEPVAVKLEPMHSIHQAHLQHEAKLYAYIHRTSPILVGIPKVKWFGREGDFNVMVMELLGPSLEDLFEFCGRQFDMKTILMLADQMISRLELMHALNYIHRDLKPENFAMGLGKRSHHCYIIDMGLSKKYREPKTGVHIPYIDGKSLTGTARYVSISTHLGVQQSRRDDLEALALVLIYFARGSLPWQGVKCPTKQAKYERIKQLKMQISANTLCEKLPNAFLVFLMYTRSLGFEEGPDYGRCRQLFTDTMEELNMEMDYLYTWTRLSTRARELANAAGSPVGVPAIVYPRANRFGGGGTDTSSQNSKWGGTTALSVSAHTEVSVGPGRRLTDVGSELGGGESPGAPPNRVSRLQTQDMLDLDGDGDPLAMASPMRSNTPARGEGAGDDGGGGGADTTSKCVEETQSLGSHVTPRPDQLPGAVP